MSAGALVTANQSNALATVQQLDPIYVDVTQSSTEVLRLRRALASGEMKAAAPGQAGVRLLLEDGSTYAEKGRLQFSEVTVDSATGSVTLRAVFPNPKHELLPGMYVRAVIDEGSQSNALLVPQPAVSRDSSGKAIATVIGADGKLAQRVLTTERTVGDQWLVSSGLQAGEKLVVEGLQKVRPGGEIKAVPLAARPAKLTTPPAPPSATPTTAEKVAAAAQN